MASEALHEKQEKLRPETLDRHRAIASIMEELEAVDWYDQRVDGTDNAELAAILAHNRDEEKEHAVMTIEWLRRNDRVFDEMLRRYVFTERSVLEVEEESEGDGDERGRGGGGRDGSLGIGSLREGYGR